MGKKIVEILGLGQGPGHQERQYEENEEGGLSFFHSFSLGILGDKVSCYKKITTALYKGGRKPEKEGKWEVTLTPVKT